LCLRIGHNQKLKAKDLRGTKLLGFNLRDADLRGYDLGDADLGDADLRNADLRKANIEGIIIDRTMLAGADLRDVEGMPKVFKPTPDKDGPGPKLPPRLESLLKKDAS
jgi:uncharacterized protein YjbI with pentapeptide repeats